MIAPESIQEQTIKVVLNADSYTKQHHLTVQPFFDSARGFFEGVSEDDVDGHSVISHQEQHQERCESGDWKGEFEDSHGVVHSRV